MDSFEINMSPKELQGIKDVINSFLIALKNYTLYPEDHSICQKSVENAVILERVAETALGAIMINPQQSEISKALLDKHYLRKHGKDAYYGQE